MKRPNLLYALHRYASHEIYECPVRGRLPRKNNNLIPFEYDEKPNDMHYSFSEKRRGCAHV
jgi:hypothetical protein